MLDVSVRQVERYIEQGLLTKMVRGANRVVVMRSEVEALVAGWRS
jgi:predicted site-specific integrase-resolvase